MNVKLTPSGISKWMKGIQWLKQIAGAKASGAARVCERGHAMDPNWKTCAYCDADDRAHQKTVGEPADLKASEPMQRSIIMERTTTQIDDGVSDEVEGATRFDASDDVAPQRIRPEAHQRRLTGVLVTYTWQPFGELFALHEGRNRIGSGESCDVHVATDRLVSNEHAVILCRAGRNEVHDQLSTNGTFLNEKYVERDGANLIDGALIKIGATVFEFRKFTSGGERTPEGDNSKPDDKW